MELIVSCLVAFFLLALIYHCYPVLLARPLLQLTNAPLNNATSSTIAVLPLKATIMALLLLLHGLPASISERYALTLRTLPGLTYLGKFTLLLVVTGWQHKYLYLVEQRFP